MVTENKWTDEQIVEWVTIIAIFLFACFPSEMIYLCETSLGKLFFASIIIYYAMVDPVYGIIACAVVIVYYQLDLYKSLIALHRDTLLSENMMVMQDSILQDAMSGNASMYSDVTGLLEAYTSSDSSVYGYEQFAEPAENEYEKEFLKGSKKSELLSNFRKANCDKNGRLHINGTQVRPEMADHVFREIRFPNNRSKCDPCNESCEFSVIEERINQEENLRPTSSKDMEIDWSQFFGHYIVKPMTNIAEDIYLLEKKVSNMILP
jgi:hypothetical protein